MQASPRQMNDCGTRKRQFPGLRTVFRIKILDKTSLSKGLQAVVRLVVVWFRTTPQDVTTIKVTAGD